MLNRKHFKTYWPPQNKTQNYFRNFQEFKMTTIIIFQYLVKKTKKQMLNWE